MLLNQMNSHTNKSGTIPIQLFSLNIQFGDGFIQFGDAWRLGRIDAGHFGLSSKWKPYICFVIKHILKSHSLK